MCKESQRHDAARGSTLIEAPPQGAAGGSTSRAQIVAAIARLQAAIREDDEGIQALLRNEGSQVNEHWGYMSRAGFADKSHLMRQIEKYADIYTSRVSNLLVYTPYKHFLCPRQSLAHDEALLTGDGDDELLLTDDGGSDAIDDILP